MHRQAQRQMEDLQAFQVTLQLMAVGLPDRCSKMLRSSAVRLPGEESAGACRCKALAGHTAGATRMVCSETGLALWLGCCGVKTKSPLV